MQQDPDEDHTLIMASVRQIAERDGISKPAVSKAVKKLLAERPDTPVERGGQGQVLKVSLAHYDHHRQRFTNPAKAAAPLRTIQSSANSFESSATFEEARRQSEWLKVGREKIRHQEECGQLIRRDKADRALAIAGATIRTVIARLPNRADELAIAVSREGQHGARVLLRQIAFEIGNQVADELEKIATAAPENDPLIEAEED